MGETALKKKLKRLERDLRHTRKFPEGFGKSTCSLGVLLTLALSVESLMSSENRGCKRYTIIL